MHRARQDRAADDDGVASRFSLECLADEFANAPNVGSIKVSIDLARGADANERQFSFAKGLVLVCSCSETSGFNSSGNDLPNLRFDNGSPLR